MYTALAKYYDRLMRDADYDGWTAYYLRQIGALDDGADLACGTGALTVRLAAAGKKVFGADISGDMLAEASVSAASAGYRLTFVQADMAAFRSPHRLGFVTCACDGLNYVSDPAPVFRAVYEALKPGGRFVFDVSSAYKLKKIIGNNTFFYEDDDLTYVWRNAKSARHVDMELTFFERQGALYRRSCEEQRQYIHETDSLLAALAAAGFTARADGGARDERVFFTADKEA